MILQQLQARASIFVNVQKAYQVSFVTRTVLMHVMVTPSVSMEPVLMIFLASIVNAILGTGASFVTSRCGLIGRIGACAVPLVERVQLLEHEPALVMTNPALRIMKNKHVMLHSLVGKIMVHGENILNVLKRVVEE